MNMIYRDSKVEYYGGLADLPFNFAEIMAEVRQDGIGIKSTGANQLNCCWTWLHILDISVTMTSALHGGHCRGHMSASDLENYAMLREVGQEPAPSVSMLVCDSGTINDVRLVFRNLAFARVFASVAKRIQHTNDTSRD